MNFVLGNADRSAAVSDLVIAVLRSRSSKRRRRSSHAVDRCHYSPEADLRDQPVELLGGETGAVKQAGSVL